MPLQDIKDYMQQKGYNKIDALILTHYDKDHIGGACGIISEYDVGTVYETAAIDNSKSYSLYHSELTSQGKIPVKLANDITLEVDGCTLTIDVPRASKYSTQNSNNSSLIVMLQCGQNKLLFCADALDARMEEYITNQTATVNFVKLPHHGSYLENYPAILDILNPKYCAITSSKKNPTENQTLTELYSRNIEVYETRFGQITISANAEQIEITQ